MADTNDPNTAQARLLLTGLWIQQDQTSRKLEAAEQRAERTPPHSRSHRHQRQLVADLRRELQETQRMINRLYSRFPESADH